MRNIHRTSIAYRLPSRSLVSISAIVLATLFAGSAAGAEPSSFSLATFSVDVTIPLGHRCMGILPVKAQRIVDPLDAHGLVLLGAGRPIVLVAVDWCEIRNDAYDRWRDVLAAAAETSRERVLVSSLHQHDAPIADLGAERLLASVGLAGELHDVRFHEQIVQRVALALRRSLPDARPVTHIGLGQAQVDQVASSRLVWRPGGQVDFGRGSSSGGDSALRAAPEGLIDPWLKTISFWHGETPLAALSAYATHPMSHYGQGGVSADFVGLARRRRQNDTPGALQIYLSGCSGDVTAGKYNDGAAANRAVLADRIYQAMKTAWERTRRQPLESVVLRHTTLALDPRTGETYSDQALRKTLADADATTRDRILAAMTLSSSLRIAEGRPIDMPCIDFGPAQLVLFPGEAFVGYQLLAQRLRPDSFVMAVGYGECWPGYIPTRSAFQDRFESVWRWVAAGAETRTRAALRRILVRGGPAPHRTRTDPAEPFVRDVYVANDDHPRISEGSIIQLADGTLLFATTEFVGGADHASARIVATTSADGGRTWGPIRVLQENVGKQNVMSVTLRRFRTLDASEIGMFYLVKNGPDDLHVYLRLSTDQCQSFGDPILVTAADGYHVLNNDRVTELLDGRLLCPVAWTPHSRRRNHYVSLCWVSDDGGRTWRQGRGRVDLPKRGAMEPEVLELADGQLLMIVRTQLGEIHAARSTDRGETWSEPVPWGVVSPESPATLRTIPATGDLLLVWNPVVQPGSGHGGPRTPLVAAISTDAGRTWQPRRPIESRTDQTYAYTSMTFAGERVLLSYYVRDESTGRISSRFRSIPIGWFYGKAAAPSE